MEELFSRALQPGTDAPPCSHTWLPLVSSASFGLALEGRDFLRQPWVRAACMEAGAPACADGGHDCPAAAGGGCWSHGMGQLTRSRVQNHWGRSGHAAGPGGEVMLCRCVLLPLLQVFPVTPCTSAGRPVASRSHGARRGSECPARGTPSAIAAGSTMALQWVQPEGPEDAASAA
jgi:hypothetical protein